MPTILCNAGPLIALGKLNYLHLLRELHGTVQIPRAVYDEVVTYGLQRGAPEAATVRLFWHLQGWPIVDVRDEDVSAWTPSVELDPGERHVLTLARAIPEPILLIDDEAAREEARRLAIPVYGTLGVIARSFRAGHLNLEQAELLLEEVATRPDIWISARLCHQVLETLRKEVR